MKIFIAVVFLTAVWIGSFAVDNHRDFVESDDALVQQIVHDIDAGEFEVVLELQMEQNLLDSQLIEVGVREDEQVYSINKVPEVVIVPTTKALLEPHDGSESVKTEYVKPLKKKAIKLKQEVKQLKRGAEVEGKWGDLRLNLEPKAHNQKLNIKYQYGF